MNAKLYKISDLEVFYYFEGARQISFFIPKRVFKKLQNIMDATTTQSHKISQITDFKKDM
ncbi:MAG: hypothetical protein P1P88_18105 [Bacteroidales bacterium]|nr:hypothetical protein [Bacteroidales bacterium]